MSSTQNLQSFLLHGLKHLSHSSPLSFSTLKLMRGMNGACDALFRDALVAVATLDNARLARTPNFFEKFKDGDNTQQKGPDRRSGPLRYCDPTNLTPPSSGLPW
jgi:hypothetical protein